MVSIYVNGEDKTRQIRDWTLWQHEQGHLMLTCHFPSGKQFRSQLSDCRIDPTIEVERQLLSRDGGVTFVTADSVIMYGDKYAAIQYRRNEKTYLLKLGGIVFSPASTLKEQPIFDYFVRVTEKRLSSATGDASAIAKNVLRQLQKLLPHQETALHAYCTGKSHHRESSADLIYPFGVNASQLEAVERAFSSQVSLIEGPPGTGKTQTILNIIANILLRAKTVAVLSNNNAAVENVYEKLEKAGLGYLVAKLGSEQHRNEFFRELPSTSSGERSSSPPPMTQIQATLRQLKACLDAHNQVARLQAEIDELNIERRYLLAWQRECMTAEPLALEKYRLSPQKSADLMAYLAHLAERRIRFKDRIELLLNYRIFRTNPFSDEIKRNSVIYALQLHYYETALKDKELELASCKQILDQGHFNASIETLVADSMSYLKSHLDHQIPREQAFDVKGYQKNLSEFLRRFPVIGSSTHSIVNSIGAGAMLDYVIIDEASQQDIVPGILALGCARNVIIVGDRHQLPHIPVKLGLDSPSELYNCEKYSLLDSCAQVFNGVVPVTLLKEHYRCHPRIIQFCNLQFYDNQLIPMTKDAGEPSLQLLVTAKGNHTRANSNLRELDSLLKTLEWDGESDWDSESERGFISPYNAQVALSRSHLPSVYVKDTVHKFQGRECSEIVFSTVLDKKRSSQQRLGFVDDPHLVNVAVSRAKNKFTLLTGDDVFTTHNGHIAALVRHIEYYADDRQIQRAPVVSAFDLLYSEYDQSLERLNARLRASDSHYKSEQIVASILRDTLAGSAYRGITFHSQVALIQLASWTNSDLTPRERDFMKNRASCDFVLYFKAGKLPIGVIEVDGGSHQIPEQIERDALKNSILGKSGLSLLRLATIESQIEEKVEAFLANWASRGSSAQAERSTMT